MSLILGKILVGLGVGTLIGLSGLGGGVALLPVLIFLSMGFRHPYALGVNGLSPRNTLKIQ